MDLYSSTFIWFDFFLNLLSYSAKSLILLYLYEKKKKKQELSRIPEGNHESWIFGHSNTTCTCSLTVHECVLAPFSWLRRYFETFPRASSPSSNRSCRHVPSYNAFLKVDPSHRSLFRNRINVTIN